jgi:DNA-binding NtrC family response regulator
MSTVIKAMRSGASDFLNKPFKLNEIKDALDRITKYLHKRSQFSTIEDEPIWTSNDHYGLLGSSLAIQKVYKLLMQVAKADDATVLFTGASGTGKELMAKILHTISNRSKYPFIAVNCSTIPIELFENEFFGHKQGSYTDAKSDQLGLFAAADKGTLFLDEISELKLSMQAKLLRVIEDKYISPIGSYKNKKIDVRLLFATNQDLKAMVAKKTFRADLYHRINMFNIHMPPLNEHKEDIPELFQHFVQIFSKKYKKPIRHINNQIISYLPQYSFPGNVRELRNMVERAIILCESDVLELHSFKNLDILLDESNEADMVFANSLNLDEIEIGCIIKALQKEKFNKTRAARLLNISRYALDRKIIKYQIYIK